MSFTKMKLTTFGRKLQAKAAQGKGIYFSRVAIGDGLIGNGSLTNRMALVSEKHSMLIDAKQLTEDASQVAIIATLDNSQFAEGFCYRELALMAIDPDTKQEGVYLYDNAGEDCEYLNTSDAGALIYERIKIIVRVENDAFITFESSGNHLYLGADDPLTNTVFFEEAEEFSNILSGETLPRLFGKLAKAISELTKHVSNDNKHITTEDRKTWNKKADASALSAHTGNGGIHVTAEQKAAWNAKADASALSAHTGESEIHVTAVEKKAWSGKQNALTFDAAPTADSNNPVTSGGVYNAELATRRMLASVEASDAASRAYAVGELLIFGGVLREVTAAIAEGDTLAVGTNLSSEAATYSEKVILAPWTASENDVLTYQNGAWGAAPARGGLLPQAVVTTTAGASVTATLDDTVVGPVVAGEDGVATLDLPSFGTWTLTAALDEKTVSDAVEVTEVRQFEVELPIAPDVPEGAVAAYFVNAADGSDESGNGHPLTLQNCTVESGSITGKSYLQITNNLSGNVLYTQNPRAEAPFAEVEEDIRGLSFSAWVKDFALFPTQSGSSTQSGSGLAVVGQENTDYPTTVGKNIYSPLLTFKQNNTNYIDLRYSFPNDRLAVTQSGNVDAYFPDMTAWTHVVTVISLSQIFLYVNGVKYGPLALDSYSTAPLDNLNHVKSRSCPLHLGTPITASYYSNTVIYCAGLKMSNIRLYARALTDDEVSALYNNGAGV